MVDGHYLTKEGLELLKQELANLKGTARQQLAQRLRAAIQQGDLSENADYTSAKEEQGFLEGRIQELEDILRDVILIDETQVVRTSVEIGAHITVQENTDDPETFYLVGPKEADPRKGRISHESPIGKALLGHKIGDKVCADTPGGTTCFTILKIE